MSAAAPTPGGYRRLFLRWGLGVLLLVAAGGVGWVVVAAQGTDTPTTTLAAVATSSTTTTTTSSTPTSTSTTTTTTTTTTTIPIEPVGVPAFPELGSPPPEPSLPDDFAGRGIVTIAAGGADLYTAPDGELLVTAREGLIFPATRQRDEWLRVFTSCDVPAWVRADRVAAEAAAPPAVIGPDFDFAEAVVVIDPGHGGPSNIGAVGPTGLAEKEVNVLIAQRVRDLLLEPHVVDWEAGVIYTGSDIPAAKRVVLTRVGDDDAADYEAGLDFRSTLANQLGAHVMVSIHNNAGWELELEFPGSDVYYQSQEPVAAESRRLATLLAEEFQRSFAGFTADWVGAEFVGAKSRLSPRDGTSQYYGLLRGSEVPTVIAEGLYLGNRSEEAILRTPQGQQAYAEAVYRAIVRFLTTDETGGDSTDPEVWQGFAGSGSAKPDCVIPEQER